MGSLRNRLRGPICALGLIVVPSTSAAFQHSACSGDANMTRLGLMPNMDSVAAEATRIDRACTTASQGAPSRTPIFAGRNPIDIVFTSDDPVPTKDGAESA